MDEDLPEGRIAKLGDHPTPLTQGAERSGGSERLGEHLATCRGRLFEEEGHDLFEGSLAFASPDYPAPRSHRRRSSASTRSWEMVRPASMSASPWAMR